MSEIAVFAFDSNAVRSVMIDGEPWFVAADVAAILGYRDVFNMTRILDDDEKGTHSVSTPGGEQEHTIISEPGLYSAILRSKKPEAKRFKKWVTAEVLPSIRKRGSYSTLGSTPYATISHDPAHAADQFVAADRSFRAALRSARAAGLRTPRALVIAREAARAKTGLDMFEELSLTAEDIANSDESSFSSSDPLAADVSAWYAQIEPWRRYKLREVVEAVLGFGEEHPGFRSASLKIARLLEALGVKKGLRRDEAGNQQRWWWKEV